VSVRSTRLALACVALLAVASVRAGAQTSLLRIVSSDGQPVVHASVTVEGGISQITDETGEVSLGHGTRQTFTVHVRRIGYQPWFGTVDFADTASVFTIRLPSLTQPLSTVTVSGTAAIKSPLELAGFYDRWMMRQKGALSAVFIGPEELEFRHPNKITGMLYGLNGVRLIRNDKTGDLTPVSTQIASLYGTLCPMAVIIDGQQMYRNYPIDKLLDAGDVAAIEVYARGGNVPISLHANDSACGIVVFWTGSRKP
jgi:hypothetical protein